MIVVNDEVKENDVKVIEVVIIDHGKDEHRIKLL